MENTKLNNLYNAAEAKYKYATGEARSVWKEVLDLIADASEYKDCCGVGNAIGNTAANWTSGDTQPVQEDEYYVILECLQELRDPDTGVVEVSKGFVEVTGDWWDDDEHCWQSIGHTNPFWKVIAWAPVLTPEIPAFIRPRVKCYFGAEIME